MDDVQPPNYDEALAVGLTASAPSINEGFSLEEEKGGEVPSAPVISENCSTGEFSGETSASETHVNEGFEPENDVFTPPAVPPPPYTEIPPMTIPHFDTLTNVIIRDACYEYVEDNCCYGSRAVKQMIFSNIENCSSLHYRLESFGEKRQSADRTTPFRGQYIDGPENGPVPDPWSIRVENLGKFRDGRSLVEIPHTAVVRTCWKCDGRGKVTCSSCSGRGRKSCSSCGGSGRNSTDRSRSCSSCGGSGRSTCFRCGGSGRVKCKVCDGQKKLKHYKELIVTWKNHVDDYVSNTTKIPSELIAKAPGKQIFIEECPAVSPLSHSPDVKVNQASHRLVMHHRITYSSELILLQRQILWAVPITKVSYSWKRKEGEFYVYSFRNKAFFEDYPQKCCCCTCC